MTALRALCLALVFAFVPQANGQDYPRSQDYLRDLVQLSGVLGGAHAIRVACNGRDDQFWREKMSVLLGMEAPDRSPLRTAMVDAFNRGYQLESARRPVCDASAQAAEAAYAGEGKAVADRLAEALLPRDF